MVIKSLQKIHQFGHLTDLDLDVQEQNAGGTLSVSYHRYGTDDDGNTYNEQGAISISEDGNLVSVGQGSSKVTCRLN